jgi:hypothetical protein
MVVTADAELARSRRQAEQTVVLAEAESRQRDLEGRGESQRVMQVGLSEAAVQLRKIASYGDPRLYALAAVAQSLSRSQQPLVPERVFVAANGGEGEGSMQAGHGMLGTLLSLLVSEKSGFSPVGLDENDPLKKFADRMSAQVMEKLTTEREAAEA